MHLLGFCRAPREQGVKEIFKKKKVSCKHKVLMDFFSSAHEPLLLKFFLTKIPLGLLMFSVDAFPLHFAPADHILL